MTAGGYDPAFYETLYAAEDRHFWFRSRNRVIAALAAQAVAGLRPGYRVLELGCGDGNVIRFLQEACPDGLVVGMDIFGEGLQYARRRGARLLVQADVAMAPFAEGFNVIGMFDVLEHIADDHAVLRQVFDLLSDRGTLLLTVPANQELWSYFDEASHHCRRYELEELRAKLREAGFTIDYLTPYMMPLYPLMWIGRRAARFRRRQSPMDLARKEFEVNPFLNMMLNVALSAEPRWLTNRVRLPIGTSLIAVARKEC
jgi:SAM-dependent methyltransferase